MLFRSLTPEKAVYLCDTFRNLSGNHRKYIKIHAVASEQPGGTHGAAKSAASVSIFAAAVMDGLRTVQREANEKIILLKEPCPGVVESKPVSLQSVKYFHILNIIPALKLNGLLKEFQSPQSGLAALEAEGALTVGIVE